MLNISSFTNKLVDFVIAAEHKMLFKKDMEVRVQEV